MERNFINKPHDQSRVYIHKESTSCIVNEVYEFTVDASEAGEGQLEIAVNEGEIPNQVQVLNNGKCIVTFVPEEVVPHVVDIKFNGHNVKGCPFLVDVITNHQQKNIITPSTSSGADQDETSRQQQQQQSSINTISTTKSGSSSPKLEAIFTKNERVLVNNETSFSLENIKLDLTDLKDIIVIDPDGQLVNCNIIENKDKLKYIYDFKPSTVGDHVVDIKPQSLLFEKLPSNIIQEFPFPLKVFDHNKVLVSEVTDGVVGHPIYFFIDASEAGSGNLEIRVSSSTRNVPNHPQSEANAKIRVNFIPTEPVEHSIDIKFNGLSVPANPFLVKVAREPQAKLSNSSPDILKHVSLNEKITFHVDYIGSRENGNLNVEELKPDSCQVGIIGPDLITTKPELIELIHSKNPNTGEEEARFKITFKPIKIGPHKLFIRVNNELLPSSPLLINVCNIYEVKVIFDQKSISKTPNGMSNSTRPIAQLNKPLVFTVDASKAGAGTLALVVLSNLSHNPIQTEVNVSDKGHGLYELTFVPIEFAPHSIDMSFNEKPVPNSPFVVDIIDEQGNIAPETITSDQPSTKDSKSNKTEKKDVSQINDKTINEKEQLQESKPSIGKDQVNQLAQNLDKCLDLNETIKKAPVKSMNVIATNSKKSLAYGLVNASNIVYLEAGVLENNKNQISLIGPRGESVPFVLAKGSPQRGEPKKTYIEYKPKEIGTHIINVLENGNDLRQYFVETCDPSLVRVLGLEGQFVARQPVTFKIDSQKSGEIQLDNIYIVGPKNKVKDGENTLLSRIKSMSSSSNSSSSNQSLEYSIHRINDHEQEVSFIPQIPGKHQIHIRCLGQPVGNSPYELDVKDINSSNYDVTDLAHSKDKTTTSEEEILSKIVVHGVSLKCSPANSTGAFIIETNRLAQAKDFDVFITDPNNSLVDVQCYLQHEGNLLAEWIPRKVGPHKIEVLYKDQHVPNSPFITEAFDPSNVIIDRIMKTSVLVNETIEFTVNRKLAGHGELDVAISSPAGHDLPIDVKPLSEEGEIGEVISFVPPVSGKYKLSILFGGFEVPKSPVVFTVRDKKETHKITGTGLKGAEVNRTAQFMVETSTEGQLKVRIECGDREIVPKLDQLANTYTVKYKPIQIGYATISLYWNGTHIDGSPFAVPINDLSKVLFLSGSNRTSNNNNQRIVHYEPGIPRDITLDTSKCGPGELVAEAYCRADPATKFSLPVDQFAVNRYKLTFLCPPMKDHHDNISTEATYIIRFYYNNLSIPEQLASVLVSPLNPPSSNNNDTNNNNSKHNIDTLIDSSDSKEVNTPIVSLRGHGLAEARTGEPAEFTINGSKAGPGEPKVTLRSSEIGEINVTLEAIEDRMYRAIYTVEQAGKYTLNVLWDNKQVAGCPITVNVTNTCDPTKILCTGDGLKGGVLGEEIKILIDTRRAGSGELTALCTGPQKVAFCELLDRGDGTFILYIKPQEAGRQYLTIKYGGIHIPKSPFMIKVSGKPDPSKVRVHGPGVEHGVLSLYQSRFVCDTRGAGAGQLTVRIRGPKGAFRMETQRENQRDRSILCKYDPTEPGDYRIEIKWSGHHVPGSPFHVMIFDTQEELNRFLSGLPPFYYNY